jgi:tetratricopeptide (TPR) repeat protein/predicted Ser/Thr protein kinase
VAVPPTIGRYEIIGSIGSGGMGTLLRARDPKIGGRTVAIKLLKEGIDNDEIRRRFMQEANAAGVLEHENIVRIFDVGEQDGEPFIAMEFIDGETLSMWIRRKEAVPLVRKLRLIEELCDGLAYAHSFNIVHRDIKPANLMVEKRRGRLKILDFGIAKLADSGITNAGALIGSFNYMSPEQVRGLPIDHRSDIFSVGAVMFELLSYRQAFPGGLGDGVLGRIAEQPAPRLRQIVPDADPEIEQIINKALEKDPARRYPDLPAMHRDLTRVRRRLEREDSSEHTRVDDGPRPASPPARTPVPGKSSPEAERLARIRAEQVAQHLDAAAKAFAAGRFDEAIEHTYRASAVDEDDPKPQELRARAQAALDDQHAQEYLEDAQAALDRGEIDAADSLVGRAIEVRPGHTGIGVMREAVARARNQVALAAVMQRARAALEQHDYAGAIRATAEAELYQPGLDEARAIRQRAQAAIDEQAARERARQERIRHAVEQARRAIVHGALDEARAHAEQAARDNADARTLDGLRSEIEAARQAAASQARRSAQAAALLGEAMARFDAGEFRAAIVRCDAALRIQPDEPHALDLRRRAQQALEEEEERHRREAEAERRRQAEEAVRIAREQHDRAAQAELDAARAEFDAGRHDTAIGRLQRFAPPHEAVTQGIAALRAELAELRARAEAQARAERDEAARRQAEEQRQRDAAARQAEEEQRAARAARAAALAGTARELASAGQYPQALATLTEASRLDPGSGELQELTRQIRETKAAHEAAERRARDLAAKIAEAERCLGAGDLHKARKAADAAGALDPQAPAVEALHRRISEAEARAEQQRAEQQRAAEAARQAQEAARQAKDRDQKVSTLIAKARKAKKPEEALRLLEEAQRIDPQRPELGALIAERQAEIAHRPPQPPPPSPRPAPPGPRPLHGPDRPETRKGLPVPAVLGGVAALVALVGGGAWYFWPDPDPPPPVVTTNDDDPTPTPTPRPPVGARSTVRIVVAPFARVTLTPVAGGEPLTCDTPCQLDVAPGDYELIARHQDLPRSLTERLSVPAGQPLEVRRTMPGFDVDRAVASIVR